MDGEEVFVPHPRPPIGLLPLPQVMEGPSLRNGIVRCTAERLHTLQGSPAKQRNVSDCRHATSAPNRGGAVRAACMPIFPISRTSTARYTREGGRQEADSVPFFVVRSGECAYGNLKYDIRLRTHGRSVAERRGEVAQGTIR